MLRTHLGNLCCKPNLFWCTLCSTLEVNRLTSLPTNDSSATIPSFSIAHHTPIQSQVENLQSKFCQYEESQALVEHILQHWDRRRGLLLVPLPTEDALGSAEVTTEKQVC